jgi:hypothetical protein
VQREVLNKKGKTNVNLTKKERTIYLVVHIAVFCNSQHSQPSRFFTYKLASLVLPLIEWKYSNGSSKCIASQNCAVYPLNRGSRIKANTPF